MAPGGEMLQTRTDWNADGWVGGAKRGAVC